MHVAFVTTGVALFLHYAIAQMVCDYLTVCACLREAVFQGLFSETFSKPFNTKPLKPQFAVGAQSQPPQNHISVRSEFVYSPPGTMLLSLRGLHHRDSTYM